MTKYIQSVRKKCSCRANVVFGKYQDLVSLFVAADEEQYKGEWVVGDSLAGSIDDVVREMSTEHGLSKDRVHAVLQGRCSLNGVKFTDTQQLNLNGVLIATINFAFILCWPFVP